MNLVPQPIPGLLSLYWRDLIIGKAVRVSIFGVLIAVGIQWATLPTPPNEIPSFEAVMADYVMMGGLFLSAVALIVLAWRYLRVRKILTHGVTIKGIVEELDVYSIRTDSTQTSGPATYRRVYYANIRYAWHGIDREVCIKLPNSASVYSIFKGHPVDLVVLDTAPSKPLIRTVYLGRF